MNLVGKKVKHVKFGSGSIVGQQPDKVTVQFSGTDVQRIFQYPQGFERFLQLQDKMLTTKMLDVVEQKKAEIKLERLERDKKIMEQYGICREEKGYRRRDIHKSNIIIKCNYCNGKSSEGSIGYDGICSADLIKYNIEKRRYAWCAGETTPCKQYYEGKITREELDESEFCCHEAKMLKDWRVYAGVVQTGVKKGQQMVFKDVSSHVLGILTTRLPNEKEEQRNIFAIFMVKGRSGNNEETSHYIDVDPNYRIELSLEEAKKVKFWDFYCNENKPEVIRMGSSLNKYMKDIQAAQILKCITEIKTDPVEKEYAEHFLEHYCALKQIDLDEIGDPAGALKLSIS